LGTVEEDDNVLFCSNVLSSGRGGVEGSNRGPSLALELLDTIDEDEDTNTCLGTELLLLVSAAIQRMSRPLIELVVLLLLLLLLFSIIVGIGRSRSDRPIATAS